MAVLRTERVEWADGSFSNGGSVAVAALTPLQQSDGFSVFSHHKAPKEKAARGFPWRHFR